MPLKSLSAKRLENIVILIIILSSLFSNLYDVSSAQSTVFLISGFVYDENSFPVYNANVFFVDETSGASTCSTTDMNGYYYCMLQPGCWQIGDTFNLTIEKAGTLTYISGTISEQIMSLDAYLNWRCNISFLLDKIYSPPKLSIGRNANFTYLLTNTGNDTEKFNISYELPIGWNAFLSCENITLSPSESALVSLIVIPLGENISLGENASVNLTVYAVRNSTVSKKDASICKLIHDIDLFVDSSDISFIYPTSEDPYVFPVEIRAKLRNLGNENASFVSVRFYVDGTYLFGLILENLFSYLYAPFTIVSSPWTPNAGLHNITLFLDENNEIEETNETNNQVSVYLLTDHPPEVDILSPQNGSVVSGNLSILGTVHDIDSNSNLEVTISISQNLYYANVDGETWNLTIDTTQLQNGIYNITVSAYDTFLYSVNKSLVVRVANQISKPKVNIFSPSENDNVSGILCIKGNATDADGDLSSLEIRLDDGVYFSPTTIYLGDTELNFSYELDTSTLSEGLHTLYVRAIDYSGLSTECMVNFSVKKYINSPPVTRILSPLNSSVVSGIVSITGNISDDGNYISFKLYIGTNEVQPQVENLSQGSWNFSLQWDTNSSSYPDGKYTIKACSFDGVNYGNDTISVTVSNPNSPPIANLVTNRTGTVYVGEVIEFNASTSFDPDGFITEYMFDFNDSTPKVWSNNPVAIHSYTQPGVYFPAINVRDNRGLESGFYRPAIEINVIDIPEPSPIIEITAPKPNSTLSGNVTISGKAYDEKNLVSVEVSIDNGIWTNTLTSDNYANWSYLWNTSLAENGAHIISARAFDGKSYSTSQIQVFVNNTPPTSIIISAKSDKSNYYIGENANISGLVKYNTNVSLPNVNVNITIKETNANWNTTTDNYGLFAKLIPVPSSPGNYEIILQCNDSNLYGQYSIVIVVKIPSHSDLSIHPSDLSFTPTVPEIGEKVLISAVVRNLGEIDAYGKIQFFIQPYGGEKTLIGTIENVFVEGKSSFVVNCNWTATYTKGGYNITVNLSSISPQDYDCNNNEATAQIYVKGRPDFKVSNAALSNPKPKDGDFITVSVELQNVGVVVGRGFLVIYTDAPYSGKKIADSGVIWLNEYSKKKVQLDFVAKINMKNLYFVLEDCPDERNLENNILLKEFTVEPKSTTSNPEVPCIQEGLIIVSVIIVAMLIIALKKPRVNKELEDSPDAQDINTDINAEIKDVKDVEAIAEIDEEAEEDNEEYEKDTPDKIEKITNSDRPLKKIKKIKKENEGN